MYTPSHILTPCLSLWVPALLVASISFSLSQEVQNKEPPQHRLVSLFSFFLSFSSSACMDSYHPWCYPPIDECMYGCHRLLFFSPHILERVSNSWIEDISRRGGSSINQTISMTSLPLQRVLCPCGCPAIDYRETLYVFYRSLLPW